MCGVQYSDAVKAFAAEQDGGLPALQAAVDAGIRELISKDLSPETILDIFFHHISWHGEYNILLVPIDDILHVDVAEWEEIEVSAPDGTPFMLELPVTA